MDNENMNNVAEAVVETMENAVPEVVQDVVNEAASSKYSGLAAFGVGAGTAVGGYLIGKYVVEPVAKKIKTGISKWWGSRKNAKGKQEETEATSDNIDSIPDDIEETHKIG